MGSRRLLMSCCAATHFLYTLFWSWDLSSFGVTASVEGHTRCEAGPQSHSSCYDKNGERAGLPAKSDRDRRGFVRGVAVDSVVGIASARVAVLQCAPCDLPPGDV